MVGSGFASTITAIGGYFYNTNSGGTAIPGTTATLTVNSDVAQTRLYDIDLPFFGAIDLAGIPSFTFDTDVNPGDYATISNLTVGAATVPLPPSALLLGSGLLGLVGLRRRFRG